eukprot:Blabericola_migrator_1__7338@NODE_372_length_9256_cov_73_169986_g297_i0_p3_GENE_NODE_372_length_9256_cov_73_169986_g297_i0NODE_372_length_9256_cov_73_169986_g297_i0_p3_ORF_typecomplete_len428_score75_52_NODE_372_length_9256_cov_73_169986_g297_i0881371
MSEQSILRKRPKNGIEAVLQNYKRCKVDRESRAWDWAAKELTATAKLREGDKIYVKFDVETTYTPEEDEDDQEAPEEGMLSDTAARECVSDSERSAKGPVSLSRLTARSRIQPSIDSPGCLKDLQINLTEEDEEEPIDLGEFDMDAEDEDEVGPDAFGDGGLGGPITTTRIEKDVNGKAFYVVNEEAVWWPAVVKRTGKPTCESLRSLWKSIESDTEAVEQISQVMRKEITTYVEERGDAPVWNVRYEPRENFDQEDDLEWCAFFVDSSTLIHLEKGKVCIAPFKKAKEDGSCPADDPELAGQSREYKALNALGIALGVMRTRVSEAPSSAGHTLLTRTSAECAGKFGNMLKGFFREMETLSPDGLVTAHDVWKYFQKNPSSDDTNSAPVQSTTSEDLASATAENDEKDDQLEEAPFPRLPDSPDDV